MNGLKERSTGRASLRAQWRLVLVSAVVFILIASAAVGSLIFFSARADKERGTAAATPAPSPLGVAPPPLPSPAIRKTAAASPPPAARPAPLANRRATPAPMRTANPWKLTRQELALHSSDLKNPSLTWAPRTGTFTIDSRASGFSIGGVFSGTYAVSGREMKLHIDKGQIVRTRVGKQEQRQVAYLIAAITAKPPEGQGFRQIAPSERLPLNQEIDFQKSITLDGTDLVIPLNGQVPSDFAGCWLSMTFGDASRGVCYAHGIADFAPSAAASGEEKEPIGHYRFTEKIDAIRGEAKAWDLQNVTFSREGMFINGEYENGGGQKPFRAMLMTGAVTPGQMTFGLQFKLNPDRESKCLLVGDRGARWFAVGVNSNGLTLSFNNGRQYFPLEGIELDSQGWNRLVISMDARNRTASAYLNGLQAKPITLPEGFAIDANKARRFDATDVSFTDYSSARTFSGWVAGLIIYNRALGGEELAQLATRTNDGWAAPQK